MTIDEAPEPIPIIPDVPRALSPLVRRICADNPGVMTGPGTNTYLIGVDEIAVIDPGPADEAHLDAVAGCGGDRIRWILLTHTHPDHGPGAIGLKKRTGAHESEIRELSLSGQGVKLGEPLKHLRGVITWVPTLVGDPELSSDRKYGR